MPTGVETQAVPQMTMLFNPYVASILLLLALFIGKVLFNFADALTNMILGKNKAVLLPCILHQSVIEEMKGVKDKQDSLRKDLPEKYVMMTMYLDDIKTIKDDITTTNKTIREDVKGIHERLDKLFENHKS